MNGSRGSYSLNGGSCTRPVNGALHFTSTVVVAHDSSAKSSSAINNVSATSHVIRTPVTSPYQATVTSSNGASNKLLNGQHASSASENGNGIVRYRTTTNNGCVSGNMRVTSEASEAMGPAGTRSPMLSTPCAVEKLSQFSNGDVIRTSAISPTPQPPQFSRQNGNGNYIITGTAAKVLVQNGDHRQVEYSSNLRNGRDQHQLETTDIDTLDLEQLVDHPFFSLTDDSSQQDSFQIVSSRGTVRGVRNRVKAGIAVFVEQHGNRKQKDYRALENGKIVVYTTSVMVVRDTYDKCLRVNKILQTHVVRYEQRDVSLSRDDHRELIERLGPNVDLPQVFADGIHIGDADEIVRLNENGTLRKIFHRFKTVPSLTSCLKCGGYRYVPCANCHGSKKSRRNNFTKEFCALRCTICDDNGLVLCDVCSIEEVSSCF